MFKAHAVPQGFCANLINALKLLVNKQEDGDGLLQKNVMDLGNKESRKGLANGLREFIRVDTDRALDVGSLSRGTRTFRVRKPKAPEVCPEVIVRESPDELTLRAEEVETSKALINVDKKEQERSNPPLVDADWQAFCQALYKGIEGEDWEEMFASYLEKIWAVEVKKPQDAQKAKAFWKMKEAKDAGEEYYLPMRENNIKGRNKTILSLWEEHLKDPIVALPSSAWKISTEAKVGSRLLWNRGCNDLRPCGFRSYLAVVGRGLLAFSGCMGQCASTHSLYAVEPPREVRTVWRALLLPFEDRAENLQSVGSVWAQHPRRRSESMCLDLSAHDG